MAIDAVVIGAGGFGRETLDVIEAHNRANSSEAFNVLGVVDDAPSAVNLERLQRRGYAHLGGLNAYFELPERVVYFVGVGSPEVRQRIVDRCSEMSRVAGTVIHPTATVGSDTLIGAGVVVCGGVQISTNVRLDRHVHLNPGCIIGHDATLADFVSINPGAVISGDVTVSARTLIGAGAVVLQGLTIGEGATVGASACVTRSVRATETVIGVPARVTDSSGLLGDESHHDSLDL